MDRPDWNTELACIPRVGEGKRLLVVTPGIPHSSQGASTGLELAYNDFPQNCGDGDGR